MAIMSNSTIKFQKIYNPFKESLKLRLISIASNVKLPHIYQRITFQSSGLKSTPNMYNGFASDPLIFGIIFHNFQRILCCVVWDLYDGVDKIISIFPIGMPWSLFLWLFERHHSAFILPFAYTEDLKQNHMDDVNRPINMILKRTKNELVRSDFFTEASTVFWP